MQLFTSSASASYSTPTSHASRLLRVLVIGPELLAHALHALLSTIDDLQVLAPICEPDQALSFIERVNSTGNTINVVVLYWSGDLEGDHDLLRALSSQRCLVVTSLYFPGEIDFIRHSGAWGLFFATSPVRDLVTSLRTIAAGQPSFPKTPPSAPERNLSYLTRPRQMAFHEERLRALGREIMWDLSETDIQIFRHFTDMSIEEIAPKVHLRPTTVRRELSQRIYEFLKLISGQPVPNRFVALQVLLQYGVLEYLLPPPPKKPPGKHSASP